MKNFKKTLAMISSVVMAGAAFAACVEGNDAPLTNNPPTGVEANEPAAPADDGNEPAAPVEDNNDEPAAPVADNADSKLTVLCWNTDDINPMIEIFCANTNHTADEFNVQNFGVAGGDAAEAYDLYLGDTANDADIMFVEADWALKYINDDSADKGTKPLSDLGFSDGDYKDLYDYTVEIGKSTSGVQKGLSWQAAAGGFCYRTDLAEQFLDVKSPDEFQNLVSDWDKFMDTAAKVKEASGGKTAMTATLGGVAQVFFAARTTPWVKDGKLTLDPVVENYINLAKTMYDEGYVMRDVGQWDAAGAWYAAGQNDATMGYFISTWGFGDAILTTAAGGEGGATYGKWNCVVGPQPFYWGGTWLTVANRCDNPTLAKEFIEFFTTNTATAQIYAEQKSGGEYVSNKAAMAGVIDTYPGIGVLGGQNQYAVLNTVADTINNKGAITPYDITIKNKFNDAVGLYCQGELATPDDVINDWVDNVAAALGDQIDYSNFD